MALPPGHSRYLVHGCLAADEKVEVETRASKWFFFPGPVLSVLLLLFLDYAIATGIFRSLRPVPYLTALIGRLPAPALPWGLGVASILLGLCILLTLGAGVWLVSRYLLWAQDSYVVTDDRLIEQTGIFRPEVREIPLNQVRNIDVDQGTFRARLMGFGNLTINSLQTANSGGHAVAASHVHNPLSPQAGEPGVEYWIGVPNPLKIQKKIEEAHERFGPDPGLSHRSEL